MSFEIAEEDLIELLKKEDTDRKSKSIQRLFEEAEQSVNSEWMDVAAKLQYDIVKEYLFKNKTTSNRITKGDVKLGVEQLRSAARRHPEIAHYVKYNRARDCPISIGTLAPNILMARSSNQEIVSILQRDDNLNSKNSSIKKPLVIIAGSIT